MVLAQNFTDDIGEALIALVNLDDSLANLIHFVARLIYFN